MCIWNIEFRSANRRTDKCLLLCENYVTETMINGSQGVRFWYTWRKDDVVVLPLFQSNWAVNEKKKCKTATQQDTHISCISRHSFSITKLSSVLSGTDRKRRATTFRRKKNRRRPQRICSTDSRSALQTANDGVCVVTNGCNPLAFFPS